MILGVKQNVSVSWKVSSDVMQPLCQLHFNIYPCKTQFVKSFFRILTTKLFQLTEGTTWQDYLGNETDPKSRIMIRFPDGRRESKNISCSSQFMVSKDNYHLFFYNYLCRQLWKYRMCLANNLFFCLRQSSSLLSVKDIPSNDMK